MKKLSQRHKSWLVKKSIEGNYNKRSVIPRRFQSYQYDSLRSSGARITFRQNRATLIAPKDFTLSQNPEEVLNFLNLLRRSAGMGVRLFIYRFYNN